MTYLVSQLWFCLLLAWMLGNIVGWLLRGGCSTHIKRVERNWRERYLTLEKEKEDYIAQINKLKLVGDETNTLTEQLTKCQEIERLNSELRSRVKDVEIGSKTIQADLNVKTETLAKCQQVLVASKKVISAKDGTLHQLANQLKTERHQLRGYKQRLSEYRSKEHKNTEALKIELDNVNKRYKAKYIENNQQSRVLSKQLENNQLQLDGLSSKLEDTTSELEKSKASLKKKNAFVEMLTATVDTRDEMITFNEKELKESNAKNTLLSHKLEGLANEFAKMATAMMKAKSMMKEENERHQAEKESFTLKFDAVEHKLAAVNQELEEKDQALQEESAINQSKSTSTSTSTSTSKIYQLERQLKHMKKKLKMVSDDEQGDLPLVENDVNQKSFSAIRLNDNVLGARYEIEIIRGIGANHGERLRKLGITNNHDLLQRALSEQDVEAIAQEISCQPTELVFWRKMADFLRIKGVNAEFAQLLALSRLNSVNDIALSNATQLLDKMKAARKKERRIRHMPELEDINKWIHEAKNFESNKGASSILSS